MEIITIVFICFGVIVLGMLLFVLFFKPKGRKVFVEFYEEMNSGNWYKIQPKKTFVGRIFRDKDGVEKLKVPKKFSRVPIEAANIDDLIPTSIGTPVLMLAKDAEQLFRPMHCYIDDKKTFRAKVEQREPLSWLFQEQERINQQYKDKNFWTQYGALITVGIIIMGGLLTIWVTADKINELNDDFRADVLGDVREQKSFMVDLVNNIKGGINNNIETSEDAEKPPTSG